MTVDADAAAAMAELDGETHSFCCHGASAFVANPGKFLDKT